MLRAGLLTCRSGSLSASLGQKSTHFPLEIIFSLSTEKRIANDLLWNKQGGVCSFLPSVLGFFMSSTLISFFLTLRVEFTSLCNLLNFTDSSVSSSDCSLDWQRNKGKVNQIIARELCFSSRVQPGLTASLESGRSAVELGAPTNLPSRFMKLHLPSQGLMSGELGPKQHNTHPCP